MEQPSLFDYVKKPSKPNGRIFKMASLFTGCGGFDLGFAGGFEHFGRKYPKHPFKIVFSNDFDADAIKTYKLNAKLFGHSEIIHDDIRNINPSEVEDFDVLVGGFPCQPFSNAGNRKGVNDKRGTLFEEVFRFISAKRPKIIVMENVKGILSSYMSDGTKVSDEIIKRLKRVTLEDGSVANYNVSEAMLLNSCDFGVPQNRHRVIIIAILKELGFAPSIQDLHYYIKPFDSKDNLVATVLDYSKSLPNVNDVWGLSPQQSLMAPHIKRSWKDIPYNLLAPRFQRIRDNPKIYHSPNFYRRFAPNEINGTITASAQPENCGIIHPKEDRRYNVREIARIQSFPDNFIFEGIAVPNMYKVIGNAVPPVMAYTIAEWCMSTLNLSNYDEVNKIKVNKSISLPQDAANCSSLVQKTEKTNKTANPDSKKENIVVGIPSILDEEIRLLASQLNLSITDIVQYAFYLCDKEPNSLSCAYKITRWMKLSFGIWIFNKNGKTIAKDFCTKNNVILKSTTPECKAIEFFADNDFLLNSLFSGKRDDFKGKITEFQANQKKTMSNDFKRCPICKETKDINKFYQDKDETISGYCKECHRNKRRINHKDNKSKAQAK